MKLLEKWITNYLGLVSKGNDGKYIGLLAATQKPHLSRDQMKRREKFNYSTTPFTFIMLGTTVTSVWDYFIVKRSKTSKSKSLI